MKNKINNRIWDTPFKKIYSKYKFGDIIFQKCFSYKNEQARSLLRIMSSRQNIRNHLKEYKF